jgi:hypothetical protein
MFDKAKFYSAVRATVLGPTLEQHEVEGCEAILTAMAGVPLSHCAYALATAAWETNRTMQPVREAYWLSEQWRKKNLRYHPWYGRGYVQLTWDYNYKKADDELDLGGSLVANPERAMEPRIAADIMRRGMIEGWFTGHTLTRHLPERLGTVKQFETARKIINGTDKAHPIALIACDFQDALVAGGW